jgi:hypothetical protein
MSPQRRLALRTISQRRIAASRSNGRKGRGPRTAEGKARASRNALRHGLATITRHNPKFFPDIERMATAICNGDRDPLAFEQALVIAENEIVLRFVRVERVAAIERLRDVIAKPLSKRDNSLVRAKARFRAAKLKYKLLVQAKAAARHKAKNVATNNPHEQGSRGEPGSGAAQAAAMQKPIRTRDEFDAMRHAMPDLERLARYERRAWSRRKRAMRAFTELRSEGMAEREDAVLAERTRLERFL